MTLDELREECSGGDWVILRVPVPNSKDYLRRLCGQRGPIGEVLRSTAHGGQAVRFLSAAVLRFIDRLEKEAAEAKEDG